MSATVAEDHRRCDTFFQAVMANPQNEKPCCRIGCAACCSEPVYASDAEVDYILAGMTPEHKATVATRLAGWLEKVGTILHQDMPLAVPYRLLGAPCPFLENNLCSIYERRPFGCRSFFASGKPEDCNLPQRDHQKFLEIPDACHRYMGVPATLNGELIYDNLGVLLHERLLGIRPHSGSRRVVTRAKIHRMKRLAGEL